MPIPTKVQSSTMLQLFDPVRSNREKTVGNGQAERLGDCKTDDEIELCWLLDRQVRRVCSMQNLINVFGGSSLYCLARTTSSLRADIDLCVGAT